ncbi:hypothetical protein B6S12_02970 [Helicobacter valdiviensis]|uniref:Peptidase M48 domain-containing protein n=1 Tax=Helicobacter valdiviensis TaxID=1458358 RepID=A0A2W6MW35_9HELI|nr:M48 family metalloprotease [Helicobacter valdiviensis]PZT48617.1 hypothetical protein B6S12_02970 [Helicobacter valdiviensis]
MQFLFAIKEGSGLIEATFLMINNLLLTSCFIVVTSLVVFVITYFVLGKENKLKGDIYELQDISKMKILWLNVLFFILLFFILLFTYSVIFNILAMSYKQSYHIAFVIVAFVLSVFMFFIVFFAYFYKKVDMGEQAITNLAKMLEAREIKEESKKVLTLKARRALEVIKEMSIAANMPMPQVFLMLKESGVNALCTGENFGKKDEKIAIFITKGALDTFNKEELQAVIGHEFSHAFHKDVALNLKMLSLVFALGCVSLVGEVVMKVIKMGNRGSGSSDGNKSMGYVVMIAWVFYAVGALGVLFSRILQAAVSRQKEYLADISSVQYTRNPQALINALKKLIELQKKTTIKNPQAKGCAHMFFLKPFNGIFATHPSLENRIKNLQKHFGVLE